MSTWIALLRGINVGGIVIRNAELVDLFRELGLSAVRAIRASGNVLFEADGGVAARDSLKARIEGALRTRFGYEAWIVLVSRNELAAAADRFPFDASDPRRQPWIIFCLDENTRDELLLSAQTMDSAADPIAPGPGVVYWNPLKGSSGSTPFAKRLSRAEYKSRTTNRNLRTIHALIADGNRDTTDGPRD